MFCSLIVQKEYSIEAMASSQPQAGPAATPSGLAYSPEDALNNDFFYDDEFSVPFDANLVEPCESEMLVDSMELGGVLSVSGFEGAAAAQVISSRSDTCLYHGDLQLSVSYSEHGSHELSISDREGFSSSDISDLHSEPLFSPAPGGHVYNTLPCMTEGLEGQPHPHDITLSSSFGNDSHNYNFDFTAHKDQYMLSFDRSPSKISSEDSFHGKLESSMTSWAQKSGCIQQSVDSSGGQTTKKQLTSWSDLCKKTERPLTSWKQLVEELDSLPVDPNGPRSRSLPELKSQYERSKSHEEPGHCRLTESCKEFEGVVRPHSMSLYEVFQRYRSPESECNEAMISPNSLHKLIGTWSMSPVSSEHPLLPDHPHPPPPDSTSPGTKSHQTVECKLAAMAAQQSGLVSWSTVGNLTVTSPDHIVNLSNPSSSSAPSSDSSSLRWVFNEVNGLMANICTQVGPGALTASHLVMPEQRHCGVQFPPSVREMGVQTSLETVVMRENKCLQTSFEGTCKSCQLRDTQPLDNIKLSKYAEHRLTSSVHLMNDALPDLSFLNDSRWQSTIHQSAPRAKPGTARKSKSVHVPRSRCVASAACMQHEPVVTRQRASLSDLRESSPGLVGGIQRRPRSTTDFGSTGNSFCSSSSSGIDPGSLDSVGIRTPASCLTDWRLLSSPGTSDCNSATSDSGSECVVGHREAHLKTFSKRPTAIHYRKHTGRTFVWDPHKTERLTEDKLPPFICYMCQAKWEMSEATATKMVKSHPLYVRQQQDSHKMKYKDVEYLQLSPTHPTRSVKKVCRHRLAPCTLRPRCRVQSQPRPASTCLSKPLKPCLRKNVDRKAVIFKHRSWSDPSDVQVMRYSQEGQTRYELIVTRTGRQQKATESTKQHTVTLGEQVWDKLVNMTTDSSDQQQQAGQHAAPVAHISTPPNSPALDLEQLLVCGCGEKLDMAPSAGSGDRSKKTVSFSERVCYHSPHPSPQASPKKAVVAACKQPRPASGLSIHAATGEHVLLKLQDFVKPLLLLCDQMICCFFWELQVRIWKCALFRNLIVNFFQQMR